MNETLHISSVGLLGFTGVLTHLICKLQASLQKNGWETRMDFGRQEQPEALDCFKRVEFLSKVISK